MIKKLTEYLGYGLFAETALVLFALVFLAIVVRTLMLRSETTNAQAKIVLGDQTEKKQ